MTAPARPAMAGSDVMAAWAQDDTTVSAVVGELDRLRHERAATGTRAAVVNLVVVAAVDAAAERVVHSVADLGAHHPGRTTVMVAEATTTGVPRIDAHVELRCSDDADRALWWEVVVLRVSGLACHHLDSVVEPLLLHDLPTVLWLAGGTSRVGSEGLVDLSNQVVISGERAASLRNGDLPGLAADVGTLARRRPLSDLAWLAIAPGRLALARLFDHLDPGSRRAEAMEVSGPDWSSMLLAAWLVERDAVDRRSVRLAPASADGHLRAVLDLPGGRCELDAGPVWPAGAAGPGSPRPSDNDPAPETGPAEARLGEVRVAVPFPGAETPRLLTTALTRLGRDPRYEAALAVAAEWGP